MKKQKVNYSFDFKNFCDLPYEKYETNFTFIVDGKRYQTSRIKADILSPFIRNAHFTDETMNEFTIYTNKNDKSDNTDYFNSFLNIVNSPKLKLDFLHQVHFAEYFYHLGNVDESIRLRSSITNDLTINNAVDRLLYLIDKYECFHFDLDNERSPITKIVDYIASHFEDIDRERLKKLPIEIIEDIFQSEFLKIFDYDSISTFILELFELNNEFSPLFEYIPFDKISDGVLDWFLEVFDIKYINKSIWSSLNLLIKFLIKQKKDLNENRYLNLNKANYGKNNYFLSESDHAIPNRNKLHNDEIDRLFELSSDNNELHDYENEENDDDDDEYNDHENEEEENNNNNNDDDEYNDHGNEEENNDQGNEENNDNNEIYDNINNNDEYNNHENDDDILINTYENDDEYKNDNQEQNNESGEANNYDGNFDKSKKYINSDSDEDDDDNNNDNDNNFTSDKNNSFNHKEIHNSMNLRDLILLEYQNKNAPSELTFQKKYQVLYGIAIELETINKHRIPHKIVKPELIYLNENYEPQFQSLNIDDDEKDDYYEKDNVFLAPEILDDMDANEKRDVYSFAINAYFMFTGRCPFDGMDVKIFVEYVKNNNRDVIPENIPNLIGSLIENCWKTDPDSRFSFLEIIDFMKNAAQSIDEIDTEEFQSYIKKFDENESEDTNEDD